WGTRLPRLDNEKDLDNLRWLFDYHEIDVSVFDTLYLMAGDGVNPGSVFSMGERLLKLAETCLNAGCTPGIVHHSTKELAPGRPMTLQDLTGAGVAEFSRQWILVNSRTPYDPARPGRHDLIVSYGGSAGHGGLLAVSVDEGELKKDFSGRKWDVAVRTLQE